MSSVTQSAQVELGKLIQIVSEPLSQPLRRLSLLQQSLLFAELSHLAYFSPAHVAGAAKAIGFTDYHFLNQHSAQAYVFVTCQDCVVVFRGTEPDDPGDIKADVDVALVIAETLGRVHRGFKREVDHLWRPLEQLLRGIHKPLWFTGHSLGGAMATISAGRCALAAIPGQPQGLFTFGSPRVGSRRYINFVKLNHYRWVNNNDIVTRLPPRWLGYRHTGQELYMNAHGQLMSYSRWQKYRDRWLGFLLTLRQDRQLDYITDHLIESYIRYLLLAVEQERQGRVGQDLTAPAAAAEGVD